MEKTDFDVFLWANEIDEVKNNVSAELFLFNKNYTPYMDVATAAAVVKKNKQEREDKFYENMERYYSSIGLPGYSGW